MVLLIENTVHAIDESFARELVAYGKSEVFKTLPSTSKKKML